MTRVTCNEVYGDPPQQMSPNDCYGGTAAPAHQQRPQMSDFQPSPSVAFHR